MKKLVLALLAFSALFVLVSVTAQEADFKIIVRSDNDETSISQDDAADYFLKKKSQWPNGDNVSPVDLTAKSPVREAFSRTVFKRSVSSIKNLWQRQIFSGREVPPPELASDADVIAHVQGNRGAIGYVAAGTRVPDSVKVLPLN